MKNAETAAPNSTLVVLIGTIISGVIAISAIAAGLRRQRMLREQASANDAERAERARREAEDLAPGSPEAFAAQDAIDYPGLSR